MFWLALIAVCVCLFPIVFIPGGFKDAHKLNPMYKDKDNA